MDLELEKIRLPLRVNWKISRNSTTEKQNYIITLRDEGFVAKSEIAPNIRYGETLESIEREFEEFKNSINDFNPFEKALDANPWKHSLRFALESAWLNLEAQKSGIRLHELLKAPAPINLATSMSVPIMEINEIASYLEALPKFSSYKIKVNQDVAWDMVKTVSELLPGVLLRIDGNEAWNDIESFLVFQEKLSGLPIEFIEQPFPASRKDLYQELHHCTPYIVMADESIEDHDNLEELATMFRAVNIKLMKTGSLLKGRDFLIKARKLGLKTMVGCMVETTLGISYAMQLGAWMDWADLDGFLLLKEDPFHLVTEEKGILRLV